MHTALPTDHGFATQQLNTHFVRPITVSTGLTRCEVKITHGARIATAEGQLVDINGKLYAHGTPTCMTFPLGAT